MGEPTWNDWVAELAPGRTFADVGGLWGTVNEKASVASQAGAMSTTMIDVAEDAGPPGSNLWELFRQRLREQGVQDVQCVRGSVDDPSLPGRIGSFEIVNCSGVLYHCPNPLYTLRQLRRITGRTLLLGTVVLPESVQNPRGTLRCEAGGALFVPAIAPSPCAVLSAWLDELETVAEGINAPVEDGWRLDNYDPWWWLLTRTCVDRLLEVAGFEIEDELDYWPGVAVLYRASPRE